MLPTLKKRLSHAVNAADARIEVIWRAHWAVWGPGEGPDQQVNDFVDEGFDEADLQIEFPVENKVETKRDLKIKDSTPASIKKGKKGKYKK